jgi:F-type H+-transporting ATPase subunit b
MEIFVNPEFWVAVAFVIGVSLMWWQGSSAIAKMLDGRADKIRQELDEAKQLREEAERTLSEYQRRQREALNEAKGIAERAQHEAERAAAESVQQLENTIKRRAELALERIGQAEAAAVAEVRSLAVDVAIGVARQLMLETIGPDRGSALISDAIRSLPALLH